MRFYDPYLNRFLQPDTIIPELYNPQSLNRYSYVGNNSINRIDPTGHRLCENGHCDQVKLEYQMADNYNWVFNGNDWTGKDISRIFQAGRDISRKIGGDNNVKQLVGNLEFDKKNMINGAETLAHHIWLNSDSSKWNIWSVVHEIGHSIDASHGWELSRGLMKFTGGYQLNEGPFSDNPACLDQTAPGCNSKRYFYGGVPPKGSDYNFNRKEDFAESFAALVYPDQALKTLLTYPSFQNNPLLQYDNYLTTPRGVWMSAIVYLLSH